LMGHSENSTVDVPDWEWDVSDPFAVSPSTSIVVSPVSAPAGLVIPMPPTSMSSAEFDCPPTSPPTTTISVVPPTSMSSSAPDCDSPPTVLSQPVPTVTPLVGPAPVSTATVVSLPSWCPPGGVPAYFYSFELLEVPPPTVCEVNVAPRPKNCVECIPGIFFCAAHEKFCGGESFICCSFCLRCLCVRHMYCPCDVAIQRRRKVAMEVLEGKIARPPRVPPFWMAWFPPQRR